MCSHYQPLPPLRAVNQSEIPPREGHFRPHLDRSQPLSPRSNTSATDLHSAGTEWILY